MLMIGWIELRLSLKLEKRIQHPPTSLHIVKTAVVFTKKIQASSSLDNLSRQILHLHVVSLSTGWMAVRSIHQVVNHALQKQRVLVYLSLVVSICKKIMTVNLSEAKDIRCMEEFVSETRFEKSVASRDHENGCVSQLEYLFWISPSLQQMLQFAWTLRVSSSIALILQDSVEDRACHLSSMVVDCSRWRALPFVQQCGR